MALKTVTHAIEAPQRIMQNLRPAILEQGLVAALQWMSSRFEKRTGIECELRTKGLGPDNLAKANSFGLRGPHERASRVGGWIDLSSGEAGTSMILSVLLGEKPEDRVRLSRPRAGEGEIELANNAELTAYAIRNGLVGE